MISCELFWELRNKRFTGRTAAETSAMLTHLHECLDCLEKMKKGIREKMPSLLEKTPKEEISFALNKVLSKLCEQLDSGDPELYHQRGKASGHSEGIQGDSQG